MPDQDAAGPVAAYPRGCLAAARADRHWFRAAVTRLEAAGERIVQTEQPAADGSTWKVLDWRTGMVVAAITGGQDDYDAGWQDGWTDVAWIGIWPERLAESGQPAPDWPAAFPPPPPVPDPPAPLDLPLPGSLADLLQDPIEAWALEAAVIPGRAAEVADLTGWAKSEVLACTASWLAVPGAECMRTGDTAKTPADDRPPSRTRRNPR